jgi:hypothetical protein
VTGLGLIFRPGSRTDLKFLTRCRTPRRLVIYFVVLFSSIFRSTHAAGPFIAIS